MFWDNVAGLYDFFITLKNRINFMAAARFIALHVNKGKTIAQSLGDRSGNLNCLLRMESL